MTKKFLSMLMSAIIFLACIALFWSGNYVIYIVAYVFSFIFLLCYTVFSASNIFEKVIQTLVYALIMVVQILFDTLVIRTLLEEDTAIFSIGKLLGILLIFLPLLVKQLFFFKQNNDFPSIVPDEHSPLPYSQLPHNKDKVICSTDLNNSDLSSGEQIYEKKTDKRKT